ncbi:formate-dependent phosphoribosylglycinamide formyltransferase (GAR transformylase) [Micromonospora sp. A200]|uniref:ATP-grasp domain-containing protein n=1 Tax=Micromonospora sp. A200 TaxID=2940568 RepID=UPI0024746801|nr:ATP-grasp domain-containing protein [Micromonospora sp. A200]MDH6463396.1 formate-dependent phosphoribosylglycinamide formyltransferase (GAR transformylase) [Micromonospora sp. A200]
MNRSILVVYRPAAGRYATQFRSVVAAAAELGVAAVALIPTGQPAAEVAGLPCYRADLDDPEAVRSVVAEIVAAHPVERIFPLFEGDVLTAARCRRDHGIPGLDPEQALTFRDKNVMHRRATELGVPVARSCRPDTVGAVAEFAAEVGYPVVVKPYAGWACGDTHRVDSAEDLDRVWPLVADARHDYRVEEYVRGVEYHVDSLLCDGEVVFEQLSRYTYSILEFRDEPGGTVSRKHDLTPAERRILAANGTVLRGFGMRTGVAHVEFFLRDDGEVVFGEAAARAGGGSIVPAIQAGRGINLAGEWCRLELDPGHVPAATLGPEIGTEYLCSDRYGRITAITTAEELRALDSVLDADVWKSVGDVLAPPTASNDVLGWYVCEGRDFDDVRARFKTVRDSFQVRTAPVDVAPAGAADPAGTDTPGSAGPA